MKSLIVLVLLATCIAVSLQQVSEDDDAVDYSPDGGTYLDKNYTNDPSAATITTDNTNANDWSNEDDSKEAADSNVNENSKKMKTPTGDNRNTTTTGDNVLTENEQDNSTTTGNDNPTATKNSTYVTENDDATTTENDDAATTENDDATTTENDNTTAIENDNTTSADYYNITTPYSPSPVITEITLTDKPGDRGVSEECLYAYTICTEGVRQKGQPYCPAFRNNRDCIDKMTTRKSQHPCTNVEQARLEMLDCEPSRLFNWAGEVTQTPVGDACAARVTECVSASKGVATLIDSRSFVTLFCNTISSDSVCLAVDKDGSFCSKEEYESAILIAKCCSVPALASCLLTALALLVQTLTAN